MGRPVVHFEIGCRDKERTESFYTNLFEWSSTPYGPAGAQIDTGSGRGVNGHITSLGHEPHNYVLFYVEVDDIPAYLEKATALGATVMVGDTEIPGTDSRFAWVMDPEGTLFGLYSSAA